MGEIVLPGNYSATEESILEYLYAHPGGTLGTFELAKALNPDQNSDTISSEKLQEAQYGIETLIVHGLVSGKRTLAPGNFVYHAGLTLTTKGEVEAIKQSRRIKKIVSNIPRPNYEK